MDYRKKYIKYKTKYISLKSDMVMRGGGRGGDNTRPINSNDAQL